MILADPVTVTVYTNGPACMACRQTKRHLDRRGIPYTEVRLDQPDNIADRKAIEYIGFTEAPVVCANADGREQSWSGYRPDRIDALAKAS